MTILDTRDKLHAFTALPFVDGFGQLLVQIVYQHTGIIRLKIATIMGDDLAVSQRDDVTTDGEVVVGHLIADRSSFKRTTTLVDFIQVVTQNRRIGNLAARRKSFGHRNQSSTASFLRQLVHHRLMGILQ